MNYHQSKLEKELDPTCRFCLEEDESSFHVIALCPAFCRQRYFTLGSVFLGQETLEWSPQSLICFLRETSIDLALDPILWDD